MSNDFGLESRKYLQDRLEKSEARVRELEDELVKIKSQKCWKCGKPVVGNPWGTREEGSIYHIECMK